MISYSLEKSVLARAIALEPALEAAMKIESSFELKPEVQIVGNGPGKYLMVITAGPNWVEVGFSTSDLPIETTQRTYRSSHELAKMLLDAPDLPVVYGNQIVTEPVECFHIREALQLPSGSACTMTDDQLRLMASRKVRQHLDEVGVAVDMIHLY